MNKKTRKVCEDIDYELIVKLQRLSELKKLKENRNAKIDEIIKKKIASYDIEGNLENSSEETNAAMDQFCSSNDYSIKCSKASEDLLYISNMLGIKMEETFVEDVLQVKLIFLENEEVSIKLIYDSVTDDFDCNF